MCQDDKGANFGDAWYVLVNALSNSGVSMTSVVFSDLTYLNGVFSFNLEFDLFPNFF